MTAFGVRCWWGRPQGIEVLGFESAMHGKTNLPFITVTVLMRSDTENFPALISSSFLLKEHEFFPLKVGPYQLR